MLLTSLISLALAGTALAQTPAGFSPSVNDTLAIKFGSKIVTPGTALGKAGDEISTISQKRIL